MHKLNDLMTELAPVAIIEPQKTQEEGKDIRPTLTVSTTLDDHLAGGDRLGKALEWRSQQAPRGGSFSCNVRSFEIRGGVPTLDIRKQTSQNQHSARQLVRQG